MPKERPEWYLDKRYVPAKVNHAWTEEEKKLVYNLRENGNSVDEIIRIMSLNVEKTKVYNVIRVMKRYLRGECSQCGKPLLKEDFKEQIDIKAPKCAKCRAVNSKYKRRLRVQRLQKGLCGICGKRKVIDNEHTTCKCCLSIDYRRSEIKHFCGRCHDRPIRSKVFCDICLERNRIATANTRQKEHANANY